MIHGHKTPSVNAANANATHISSLRSAVARCDGTIIAAVPNVPNAPPKRKKQNASMTAMTALNLGESLREFVEAAIVGHEAVELFFDVGNLRIHVARQSA